MTHNSKSSHRLPNMTPMVDLVMCILIFYMLASTFLTPELALAAPTVKGSIGQPGQRTEAPVSGTIELKRIDNATWLTAFGQTHRLDSFAKDELLHTLEAKRTTLSDSVLLVLQPDRHVPYQDIITVYDTLTKARFTHVAFGPAK